MLCQNCQKNEATRHYKSTVNGGTQEAHLCAECARELGYETMFKGFGSDMGFGLDSLLAHMFGEQKTGPAKVAQAACPLCGVTAADISQSGRVGCGECYQTFAPLLTPYIKRIHGNTSHTGRLPGAAGEAIQRRRTLEAMRTELQDAIVKQEFEKAAELRDKIRAMEAEGGEGK
ncbi:UvrB/UvrC motif-containing protein [Oscillospiraceae bacterium OttesenSCG-928-F05]|nr:UvrB/UvrC motif-containing protein [Oscillospiraceae bacterium OttesenSCG-928-F05]